MAPRVLVVVRPRVGEIRPPDVGAVDPGIGRLGGNHGVRDADVGDPHGTAEIPPRTQEMAGLAAAERHRFPGLYGRSGDGPRIAHDARRDVHGQDIGRCRVEGFRHGRRDAVERTRKARPEQGIDDPCPRRVEACR